MHFHCNGTKLRRFKEIEFNIIKHRKNFNTWKNVIYVFLYNVSQPQKMEDIFLCTSLDLSIYAKVNMAR